MGNGTTAIRWFPAGDGAEEEVREDRSGGLVRAAPINQQRRAGAAGGPDHARRRAIQRGDQGEVARGASRPRRVLRESTDRRWRTPFNELLEAKEVRWLGKGRGEDVLADHQVDRDHRVEGTQAEGSSQRGGGLCPVREESLSFRSCQSVVSVPANQEPILVAELEPYLAPDLRRCCGSVTPLSLALLGFHVGRLRFAPAVESAPSIPNPKGAEEERPKEVALRWWEVGTSS